MLLQQGGKSRLLEMMIARKRIGDFSVLHDDKGYAVGQRLLLIRS